MKFYDVSFPHPVLGAGDAIKSKCCLNPSPEINSSVDTYSLTVTCEHDNSDLSELVNAGKAEFICEATCSNTLFREIYKGNSNQIKFEIPKKCVKGKVFFTCILVAKFPIPNYQNGKLHPDYQGYNFEIEAGDVLAFFGEFNFNADINYEKLKAVSSFMEVVENKDQNAVYTNVDLSKSKIEIH